MAFKAKRLFEKALCLFILFVVTPSVYIFELTVVRDGIVEAYHSSFIEVALNIIFSIFSFINIVGNIIMSALVTCSVKKTSKIGQGVGKFCDLCEVEQSIGTWHCKVCDVCISNRDHHCLFISSCVGRQNRRYYLLSLAYASLALIQASFYNYYYCLVKIGSFIGLPTSLNKVWFRPSCFQFTYQSLFMIFFVTNLFMLFWSIYLFSYHLANVLKGMTVYESRRVKKYKFNNVGKHLMQVFGSNWYFAIIWPFADSPLPKYC